MSLTMVRGTHPDDTCPIRYFYVEWKKLDGFDLVSILEEFVEIYS